MDVQEIARAIRFGNFTNDELNQIVDSLKFARAQMAHVKARSFGPGDKVRFTSRGKTYFGTIDRVKIKNAVVIIGSHSRYNVPVNMLESDQ